MKKYYILLAGALLAATMETQAQTKIGGSGAPDNSAMLEVTGGAGNNKGILPPRLTTTERDAITNPASGLIIYNTTAAQLQVNTGTPGAPVWTTSASGSGWTTTGNAGTTAGVNFIGTTDSQNVAFKVNNQDKMRLTDNGLVVGDTSMVLIIPGGNPNGGINLVNNGGDTWHDDITIQSFSTLPGAGLLMYAAHGTKAAPQRMLGGQDIGSVHFRGRRTSDWGATASIVATAVGDSVNLGTCLRLATSNGAAGNAGMLIDSNAHVGIGLDLTSAPTAMLDVNGTARIAGNAGIAPVTIMGRDTGGYVSAITLGSNLSLAGGVLSASGGTSSWGLTGNAGTTAGANFIGTTDSQNVAFKVNNQDKMRLTDNGLVVGDTSMVLIIPGSNPNGGINLVNNGGDTWHDDITIQSFSTVPGAGLLLYSAHGTKAAPLSMQDGQDIGALAFRGKRPTDWGAIANIVASAAGDSAHLGTRLRLTTTNGTGTATLGMLIDSNAYVGIGLASTSFPAAMLDVNGTAHIAGNVGIGTTAPTATLSVNGTANNLSGTWGIFSDARVKTVDGDYKDGLNTIMKIHPVKFHYNADAPFKSTEQQIGIIAQEVEQVAPYMVTKVKAEGFDDLRQYNSQALPYMLVNAIQEQQKQIAAQDQKIEALTAENKALKESNAVTAQLMERVKQMEQMLGIKEIEGSQKVAGK